MGDFTGIYRRYLTSLDLSFYNLTSYSIHPLPPAPLLNDQSNQSRTMSSERENVLLFGLGGIGGVYASILSLSKSVNVHVVARSNYESVKEKGFKFVSDKFGNHEITFEGGEFFLSFAGLVLFSLESPRIGVDDVRYF